MRLETLIVFSAFVAIAPALAQQSEPPQRTLTTRPDSSISSDSKPAAGVPSKGTNPSADSRTPDSGAFDSLTKSLQDLNVIRDGNLSFVQKDGCSPELASRIADLKAKLNESDASVAAPTAARTPEKTSDDDPMAVAKDWFKPASTSKQAAPSRTRESSLLDAVLNGTPAAPERSTEPKASNGEHKQNLSEAEMASVKSELEQLLNACSAKR